MEIVLGFRSFQCSPSSGSRQEAWAQLVGGVKSARERDSSSVGGDSGNDCLGVVHMERQQVRVQVECGREEVNDGEKHGERQNARIQTLEPCSVMHTN